MALAPVPIPFPTSSFPGAYPSEGAGRLINAYAEPLGDNARSSAVIHRVPGLKAFGTSDESTFRGGLLSGSTLYAAYDGTVVTYTSSGAAATTLDDLSGTDKVFWARNNKRPTADVLALTADGIFVVGSSAITDLDDADIPSPTSLCFTGGYFFVAIADGRCFASGLNATTFDANDFITTEAKPDTLYRAVPWNGELWLCSANSIEVWSGIPVNDTGFPFNRSAVIQRGLAGKHAIAGHEDGFGVGLLWVGDDNSVHQANGYTPVKVSSPDLDRLIAAVSDKSELEASVYIVGGHPKWVLSCDDWSWEYDLNTRRWNERVSYQKTRWRGTQSVYAFGKWLTGETTSGNLPEITNASHLEVTDPLMCEIWSAPVQAFPARLRCATAYFDFAVGVGDAEGTNPIATDPMVEISWSDDGGLSFSTPRVRALGVQQVGKVRVRVNQCGMTKSQGRIWKLRISSPIHVGLMGGQMLAEPRAA